MKRDSCIELYRIIATFLVLVFHFNGWLVGGMPKVFDIENISLFRMSQAVIESFTCICVNMFLVISGYFGVRLKVHSILRICLLLLVIFIPFYLVDCLFFDVSFSLKDLVWNSFPITSGGYFIQCYFMLILLSPVINSYIEKVDRLRGVTYVFLLVIVEFWFDCITHREYVGFRNGFSVLHFIVVYMLARYVFLYRDELLKFKKKNWIVAYFLCTFVILLMYIGGINYVWQYSNPIIILSAICSFIPFLYKSYYNRWINWVAQGTLAVYIIHVTPPVYNLLVIYDCHILEYYSYPFYMLFALSGIAVIFVFSVLYEKVSSALTRPIYNWITSFL